MTGDPYNDIKPLKQKKRSIDPIKIFQELSVQDKSINDLWLAQGDALRGWHKERNKVDVVIGLNTGAGKTLVGLLIAQSLVNETRGLVLYVCSSIQLVLQTEKKAEGYGLEVTTYVGGHYSNNLAARGEAVCVTTYQALFNGKSIFFGREVAAIIFDDAHAAEHIIRDHFSLRITKAEFGDAYTKIVDEFRTYFDAAGKTSTYEEINEDRSGRILLVHPSVSCSARAGLLKALREADVTENKKTCFSWEYLKDKLDLCAVLVSGSEVTITPAFVPIRTLPYFTSQVRRVYLSATLTADDIFVRSFGRRPDVRIAPSTSAGECERMILIPSLMTGGGDDVDVAKTAIRDEKALILVPSTGRASAWSDLVKTQAREDVPEAVETFKASARPAKLLLTARYDGIDLPGDTCRIVVIDSLPAGTGPMERFLWAQLMMVNTLRSVVASRVVQSFGRISRGMSDHGVAILTEKRLVEWFDVPKNVELLPPFLQKQLQLGREVSMRMAQGAISQKVQDCLGRNPKWLTLYDRYIKDSEIEEAEPDSATSVDLALAEAKFAEALWKRDYNTAGTCLQKVQEVAGDFSNITLCWHRLWLGFALQMGGHKDSASVLYSQAYNGAQGIPKPVLSGHVPAKSDDPQIRRVVEQLLAGTDGRVRIPKNLQRDLRVLAENAASRPTEEALRCLGEYLGLESSRPDKEFRTGPDVLWLNGRGEALCIEAKTGKKVCSLYGKEDIGQLFDHVQFTIDYFGVSDASVTAAFVGRTVPPSESANPSERIYVIDIDAIQGLSEAVQAAYQEIADNALPRTLEAVVQEQFDKRSLRWTQLLKRLDMKRLRDIEAPDS